MHATSSLRKHLNPVLALAALGSALSAFGQTTGDYRSAASGNWNAIATWDTFDGANWVAATTTPTAANAGAITIQSPYFVTNSAAVTADQIVVAAGATLVSSANLTVADGSSTDLDIYGSFIATGGTSLTVNAGATGVGQSGGLVAHNGTSSSFATLNGTLRFASGGKFTLVRAGGRIPLSTWDAGSLCEAAYTADGSKPDTAYLGQNFADFTVNCPLQTSGWDFAGKFSNHVANLTVNFGANPGASELKLFSGSGSTANLTVGGNLTLNSGMLNVGSSGGPWVITLGGNLLVASGADLNVSGSASLSYSLVLNGAGTQTYTCNGTNRATKLNWTINSGSTLDLNSDLPLSTANRTLTANGTVNVNGKTVLADLIAGSGTIQNEGGGNGTLIIGTGGGTNTLGASPALLDGASGTLRLVKSGAGVLTITAPQSFSGGMVISNGIVLLNHSAGSGTGSGAATVSGGTLGGSGTVSGPVTVDSGGTLSPGSSVGQITVNNTLSLAGNTSIEVDKANATNDAVVASSINYGGTLTVTDLSGGLTAGDSFTLFSTGSHAGNFTSVAGTPGTNLAWAFDPNTGVLSVVSAAVNPPMLDFSRTGDTLTFSWTAPGFKLQSETNSLMVGLGSNWGDFPAGTVSPVTVNIDPANGSVFFRLAPQ